MATVEIRDIIDEHGNTIFPRTHVDAVIGLGDSSFFELAQDDQDPTKFSVRLKPEYTGLWADGWIAAGGVGTGGGGGGTTSYLNDLLDVNAPNPVAGDLLSWDALTNKWVNVGRSEFGVALSLSSGASYLKDSDGKPLKDSNGNYLTVGGESSKVLNLLNDAGNVISSVELPIPTISSPFVTVGEATIQLGGSASLSEIGIPSWAQDDDLAFSSLPSLFVGRTPVKDSGMTNDTLLGINGFTYEASDDVSGDKSMVVWEPNGGGTGIGAWHFKGNIYADGWIAAGGIGEGGSGGGTVFLNQNVADVSVDTTTLADGHILQWDGTNNLWKNVHLSVTANPATASALGGIMVGSVLSSTPSINTISSTAGRYYYVQCDSTGLAFVNVPWTSGSGGSTVSIDNLLSSGTRVATIRIDGTDYNILAPTSGTPGSGETDPVFSASAAYGITSSDISAWNAKVDASDLSDYALKTGENTYNFLVNTLKFSLGTIASDNYGLTGFEKPRPKWTYTYEDTSQVGSPTVTETKYLAYKDEIPTTLKNPYALTFGSYTYDGSQTRTLTASAIGAVTLAGAETITGAKTFTSNLLINAEVVVNSISSIIQDTTNHSALFNYGGRLTQKFNAYGTEINLRAFNASEQANILSVQTDRVLVGSQLLPNYATGINLGGNYSNQRWATIYGLNADLTGNLKMDASSHIDLGPVRIEYDAVNKAIHIKKADDNDNNEYGLYCDGFVAAGGVQASS